jgi:hypothetical protein
MKLYTEDQVIQITQAACKAGQNNNAFIFWEVYKNITPIELPSDEEISAESMDLFGKNSTSINDILQYKAFKRGAKWIINKITGLTNEHIKAIKER